VLSGHRKKTGCIALATATTIEMIKSVAKRIMFAL